MAFPLINDGLYHFEFASIQPDATAVRAFVQNDSRAARVIKGAQFLPRTFGTEEPFVCQLFQFDDAFPDVVELLDFIRVEPSLDVLDDFAQLTGVQPFSFAHRAGLDFDSVIVDCFQGGGASRAFVSVHLRGEDCPRNDPCQTQCWPQAEGRGGKG